MSRDLYSALSGAFGALRRLDVVANNLANVNTTGFKRERVAFETQGPGQAYARVADGLYDSSDGNLKSTGSPTDVALRGPGWLVIDGAPTVGGPALTRDGNLHVDPVSGLLRGGSGGAVLGQSGPITVPAGETVRIDDDGVVWGSESGPLDTLRVVDAAVEPLGGNLWRPTTALTDRTPNLVPGSLEMSNVQPTVAMVELIEASRTFEMLQNVMRTSDQLDDRLNKFGRGV